MKFKIKVSVSHGCMIPAWYGVAWHMYESNSVVCYIMPINKLALLIRNIYLWLQYGGVSMSANVREVYHQGVVAGRQEGYAAAEADFLEEDWAEDLIK